MEILGPFLALAYEEFEFFLNFQFFCIFTIVSINFCVTYVQRHVKKVAGFCLQTLSAVSGY